MTTTRAIWITTWTTCAVTFSHSFSSFGKSRKSSHCPLLIFLTDDKIKYLRKMVDDTILEQDNEESKCVLLTWNMLYTMSKIENDYELVRYYEHMKYLEGDSEV
jgi:hypothetical protein